MLHRLPGQLTSQTGIYMYMYLTCTSSDGSSSFSRGRYLLESFLHQSACAVHVRHKSTPPLMLVIYVPYEVNRRIPNATGESRRVSESRAFCPQYPSRYLPPTIDFIFSWPFLRYLSRRLINTNKPFFYATHSIQEPFSPRERKETFLPQELILHF